MPGWPARPRRRGAAPRPPARRPSAEAGNSLYHRDVVAWSHRQARRLGELAARTDDLSREVDWDNLIDEVLSVGRSQTAGVARKIELVLAHLLKILSDPDAPSRRHWRHEIDDVWRLRSEPSSRRRCVASSTSTTCGPGHRGSATRPR